MSEHSSTEGFYCKPCGEKHNESEREGSGRNRCKQYASYTAHKRSHPYTKITLKEYKQGARERRNPKITKLSVFSQFGFFQCVHCMDLFNLDFRNGTKKTICKLCEGYEKHLSNNKKSLTFNEFKSSFYDRFNKIKNKPKDKKLFYCRDCETTHPREMRAKRNFLCLDKYNYKNFTQKRKGVEISFREYMDKINKEKLSKIRADELSSGQFTCKDCGRIRDNSTKRKGVHSCKLCLQYIGYKNKMTFDQYESIYLSKASLKNNKSKRCPICFEIKENKYFKVNSFCDECWDCDDILKIKQLKGILGGFMSPYKSEQKFFRLLGYSKADLMSHLKSRFTKGMTERDLLNGDIHIDHIIPVTAFDHKNPKHLSYCWSLQNLQPLWAFDNISKSDKLSNGERVRDIKRLKGADYLNDIIFKLYSVNLKH